MSLPSLVLSIKQVLEEKGFPPKIDAVVILGSGLGSFGNEIEEPITVPYSEIPGFPQSTVQGHSGSLIFGTIGDKSVLAFSGRFHFYEGYNLEKTILPVQLAKAFETDILLISNAAGGINLDFQVGDLMVIDKIMSPTRELGITSNQKISDIALKVRNTATSLDIPTRKGSYLYVTGPNYETKSEIHAFRFLGGDAVGMSTAPELIEAERLGVKAAAISLITNAAAGVTDQKLDHAEVKDAADAKKEVFAKLVKGLIAEL